MGSMSRYVANTTAYAEVMFVLLRKGGTVHEIAEQSGLGYHTVNKLVRAMRRRGIVFVVLWRRDAIGRYRLPVWLIGSGPDAAKPPRQTMEERRQRYEDRRREIAAKTGIAVHRVRLRDHPEEATS